jgi:hypothetical protein
MRIAEMKDGVGRRTLQSIFPFRIAFASPRYFGHCRQLGRMQRTRVWTL